MPQWRRVVITLTVFLLNESLSGLCSLSTNPSWPHKDESQGQIAISPKRAWNRYKQQSAKVWPRIVQAIDWWIDTLNCFSWARLHLSSIKHSSIFSPRLHWWQRLIRKHLSTLSQFPRAIVNVRVLWELLPRHFYLFLCSFAAREGFSQVKFLCLVLQPVIMRRHSVLWGFACCGCKTAEPCLHAEACRFMVMSSRLIMPHAKWQRSKRETRESTHEWYLKQGIINSTEAARHCYTMHEFHYHNHAYLYPLARSFLLHCQGGRLGLSSKS